MWTGPWALPDVKAAVAAGTLSGYATSPLPEILGNNAVPFVRAQGFMVNAFSERKDLALEFLLDYLATPERDDAALRGRLRGPGIRRRVRGRSPATPTPRPSPPRRPPAGRSPTSPRWARCGPLSARR